MLRPLAVAALAALAAGPAAAQVSSNPAEAPSGAYTLESAHSQVLFSVVHFGITDYYGRFDRLSGTLSYDAGHPEKSAVSIAVDPASVDTPSPELTSELAGPHVFDAEQFPEATFKSTSVVKTGPAAGTITGTLTIHGITRPVTLAATFTGGEKNPFANIYSLGFRATATVKRSDYGLNTARWSPLVSDEVSLIIVAMFDHEMK